MCSLHLGLSCLTDRAGCEFKPFNKLATSPISQSFDALLNKSSQPWWLQTWDTFVFLWRLKVYRCWKECLTIFSNPHLMKKDIFKALPHSDWDVIVELGPQSSYGFPNTTPNGAHNFLSCPLSKQSKPYFPTINLLQMAHERREQGKDGELCQLKRGKLEKT